MFTTIYNYYWLYLLSIYLLSKHYISTIAVYIIKLFVGIIQNTFLVFFSVFFPPCLIMLFQFNSLYVSIVLIISKNVFLYSFGYLLQFCIIAYNAFFIMLSILLVLTKFICTRITDDNESFCHHVTRWLLATQTNLK